MLLPAQVKAYADANGGQVALSEIIELPERKQSIGDGESLGDESVAADDSNGIVGSGGNGSVVGSAGDGGSAGKAVSEPANVVAMAPALPETVSNRNAPC